MVQNLVDIDKGLIHSHDTRQMLHKKHRHWTVVLVETKIYSKYITLIELSQLEMESHDRY